MKTATLINEIIDSIERLVQNIRKLYLNIKQSLKMKKKCNHIIYMTRNIFNFNHISNDLTEDEISELKALYKCYHRLYKCYQWKYKRLRCLKLSLEMSSIGLTTIGSIVGAATLNPIIIVAVAGPGILIQGYLTKSNLSNIVVLHILVIKVQLKSFLRGLTYDKYIFLSDVKIVDDIVIDQCPSIDKYFSKYDSKFIE